MPSFAVTLRSRPGDLDGVLIILDERRSADEIAFELRRRGHDVEVEEFRGKTRVADTHGSAETGRYAGPLVSSTIVREPLPSQAPSIMVSKPAITDTAVLRFGDAVQRC